MNQTISELLALPQDRQAQLTLWLLQSSRLEEARSLLREKYQVETSIEEISEYWRQVCLPSLLLQRQQSVEAAGRLTGADPTRPENLDDALVQTLKQRALEICLQSRPDPKELFALLSQALRTRDQEIKLLQLAQAERRQKFLELKAAAGRPETSLTPEEQKARMNEILGL